MNLPFIAADATGPKHLNVSLTRERLEALVADLIDALVEPCETALKDAGLRRERHRRGDPGRRHDAHAARAGEGRRDLRQEAAEGREPRRGRRDRRRDPGRRAEGRGRGRAAARRDAALARRRDAGRRLHQDHRARTRRSRRKKSQVFSTTEDNQNVVRIHVLQGEREMAADNKSLGRFELVGIPPAPRGVPQIEVTFEIDTDGVVSVSAKDLGTGKTQADPRHGLGRPHAGRDRPARRRGASSTPTPTRRAASSPSCEQGGRPGLLDRAHARGVRRAHRRGRAAARCARGSRRRARRSPRTTSPALGAPSTSSRRSPTR